MEVDGNGPSFGKLKPGDVIVEFDNRTINRAEDLVIYLERYKSPGEAISLKVKRDGEFKYVTIILKERPE
jgi:S1-C subfamily serine protease